MPYMMTGAGTAVPTVAAPWARMHASTAAGPSGVINADWDETMRAKLPVDELASTWQQIVANAGEITAIGRPSIVGKGPYRVCDVPIVFEHGPMRARVSFTRAGAVSGLFITLPE
jgi:Protein of unknown function (DUF3887)